jgi:hypothetical protein
LMLTLKIAAFDKVLPVIMYTEAMRNRSLPRASAAKVNHRFPYVRTHLSCLF